MPDLVKDSAGDSLDTVVLPKTTDSGNSDGQPSSTTSGIDEDALVGRLVTKLVPALKPLIAEEAKTAAQSQKDKRLKPLTPEFFAEFDSVAAYIAANQGNVENAKRQAGTDVALQRLSELDNQAAQQSTTSQSGDKGMSQEEKDTRVRRILGNTQLPVADQKAIMQEWSAGKFANDTEMFDGLQATAISYVNRKSAGATTSTGAQTSTTSAAGVVGAVGAAQGGDTDKAGRIAGLYTQLSDLQSQGTVSQSRAQRETVKAQLRELGEKV